MVHALIDVGSHRWISGVCSIDQFLVFSILLAELLADVEQAILAIGEELL